MTRSAWISMAVVAAALAATGALAANGPPLTTQQQLGERLFTQSCMVCHTPPVITAGRYGPALSRDSAGGQADVMHGVIENGTPRMPGFKYLFTPDQIDAIVQYVKTLPPAEAKAGSTKSDMD